MSFADTLGGKLDSLEKQINELPIDKTNENHLNSKKILCDFVVYLKNHKGLILESLIPTNFANQSPYNQVLQELDRVSANINNFINNQSQTYLTTAENSVYNGAKYFVQVPVIAPKASKRSYNNSLENYKNHSNKMIEMLKGKIAQSEENVVNFDTNLSQYIDKLKIQEQSLTNINEEVEQITSSFQEKLDELKESTAQTLTEEMEIKSTAFETANEERNNAFKELKNDLRTEAEDTVNFLQEKKQEVENLVGIVGNISTTGHYKRYADKGELHANISLFLGALLSVVLLSFLIYCMFRKPELFNSWSIYGITALTVWLISVCFKLQTWFRKKSEGRRDKELNLAALPAFLATLDEEKRAQCLESFAHVYFGDDVEDNTSDSDLSNPVVKLGKQFLSNKKAS